MLSKIWRFFRWIIGFFVIILGVIFWWDNKLTSIFWILAGILITPIPSSHVPSKKTFKITYSLLCICLFIAGGVVIPTPDTTISDNSAPFSENNTAESSQNQQTENYNNQPGFGSSNITQDQTKPAESSKNQQHENYNSKPDSESSKTTQSQTNPKVNNLEEIEPNNMFAILLHQPYLDSSGIQVHYASERREIIPKIIDALKQEPVNVELQGGGLFSSKYYSLTRYTGGACSYYGDLKNNRPDGFGVLAHENISLDNYKTLHNLMYIGEFSDGRFHGYGVDFDRTSYIYSQIDLSMAGNADPELLEIYLWSYALADGKWKKGELSGEANLFTFNLYTQPPRNALTILKNNAPDNYWANAIYPSVIVTEIENGKEDGDTKEYLYNTLMYDGEMRDGIRNGEGISYFSNGQVEYDGHWKKGLFNGKGTLYDATGQEIYSGKWKDGDYAS